MAFVGYRLVTDSVHPATLFSQEVLSDDMFGAFFAIAMLIVAAMTTVGSFNYMRKHGHHAVYYSLILMSAVGMVLVAYSAGSCNALCSMGADEHPNVCTCCVCK